LKLKKKNWNWRFFENSNNRQAPGFLLLKKKPLILPKRKAEKKKRKKRNRENHRVPNGGCMTKPLLAVAALVSWQRPSVVGAQILVAFVLAMAIKFHHVGRQ
jgi:hypothetical protein